TSTDGAKLDLSGGVTVTSGVTAKDVVLAVTSAADPTGLCLNPAAPGTYTGKVVVCRRGTNARVDKGYNVLQGGAVGMILYNGAKQDQESDNHWLPAIHMDGPAAAGSGGNSDKLLAFIAAHPGVKASWVNGVATTVRGDVMAAFSSRGPLGDFIKPDVTAPGVQILAGMTPQPTGITNGPPGQLFQAIAGTSMSSPHAAGVAALIKAAHPDWTAGQIKSAMMTSSVQDTLKEDGVTPATPFERGAGAIRADRAVSPTVTFDVGAVDYVASAMDPLGRIGLNLPSINAPTMPGAITTWRTMKNVSGMPQNLEVSVDAPAGSQIIVARASKKGTQLSAASDKKINIAKDEELLIQVTIKAPTLPDGQYFGQITLDPKRKGNNRVVLPVAFNKRQGQVSLAHSCAPSSFTVDGATTCTVRVENFSPSEANVAVEVDASNGLTYSDVTNGATLSKSKDVITLSGMLIAPNAPGIDIVVAPGSTPAGYLPLSFFGIAPVAGVGDETITNFNVPAFSYGSETYTRLGIVSNGYVVIGGGTSSDVDYLNHSLPNPTPPNNVVAPFWTDLNPGVAGAVRIGTLTDGTDTWIVVEFTGVREYSTASKTVSFQTWIKIGPAAKEEVTVAYGPINGGANGDGGLLTVGAENRNGTSGRNLYYNGTGTLPADGTELKVSSTPPTAGGSLQFTYKAAAKKPGGYTTTANMASDVTPGIAQDVEALTVTP
ncbi:MAG: S8 family serine peptidase, partial [Betaproteobacteria bacterium]